MRRIVFAAIMGILAIPCVRGEVVNGVWTGVENAFWTNANNWAGGVVPGRYVVSNGAGGLITNGTGCCTATFNDVAADAATTIDLDGLLSVTNITVSGATSVFTLGTGSEQQIPIESGGRLVVSAGAKAPILAGTLLYAANVYYSYWNSVKVGNVTIRPGITIVNNSSEELAINDIGPVTTVGSTDEINDITKDKTLSALLNTEVAMYLEGTGSVRFQGARQPYSGSNYNLLHLFHRLVNPAQITVASETFVRDFQIPSGSSYGKALIEITESGCLRSGTSAIYAYFLNVQRETRIFGAGLLRSDIYRASESGRYFMLFAKNDIRAKLSIETDVVAEYMKGYSWATVAGYLPGFDLGTQGASGEVEFLGNTTNTGLVWVAGATLKTPSVGADEEQVSFGKAKLHFCQSGRLLYSGAGETTTRTLVITNRMQGTYNKELAAAEPKAILEQSGSGVWNVASPISMAGCTNGATLELANSTATNAVFSGVLADGPDGTLSIEKTGTGVWRLTAANAYTGTTTVNGGTLDIARGASISSSSGLILGGGTVNFEDGDETATFALPATTLASGTSSVRVGANVEVSIAGITQGFSGAKVNFVVPSKPVKITIGGMEEGAAPAYVTVNGRTTTYSAADGLAVPQDPSAARWESAVAGDWSDATKWSGGEVPAPDADVAFSVYGQTYAARVTSPVSLTGTLSVLNPRAGSGVTVAISNAVTAVTTNGIAIGDGGKLLVGEGGTFHFDDSTLTPITYKSDFMTVGAGGTLEIDGGQVIFTNFNGNVNVTGTEENPGVVRLKSGNIFLSGREHNSGNYSGSEDFVVGPGGRLVQTGGTMEIWSFLNGHCALSMRGGEMDVSGDSVVRMHQGYWADTKKTVYPRYYSGTGVVRFRDNAVLDPYVRTGDMGLWLQPRAAGETSIMEFHDHAKFDAPRTGGNSLGSFLMGGVGNGRMFLRLYSDAHHNSSFTYSGNYSQGAIAYVATIGDGYGYSELEMTNGTFLAGVRGLRIGSVYTISQVNAATPFAVTGVVHVTGGNIGSDNTGCMSPGWISISLLGGDMVGCSYGKNDGWYFGRMVIDGGSYTNKHGHLLVGFGHAEGEWFHNGGEAVVCSDVGYTATPVSNKISSELQYATNNVFTLGCMGGRGSLTQTGGNFRSNLRTFVGGAVSNEFTVYMTYLKYFNAMPSVFTNAVYAARHDATGYLGVLGGDFTAAHSITVGQDGTGVVEIGPTGTLHAASLVLANNAYTASGDHAATLKFTFGAKGVGTATVTNLAVASGAALTVDMRDFVYDKSKPARFPLLKAANVEGSFDDANVTLLLGEGLTETNTSVQFNGNGIEVIVKRGFAILFR